jgi:hypothetical protein
LAAVLLGVGPSDLHGEPVGPKLTSKLQDLLRQEMASVLAASQDVLEAVVIANTPRSPGAAIKGCCCQRTTEALLTGIAGATWCRK